jgi:hypothetical protein
MRHSAFVFVLAAAAAAVLITACEQRRAGEEPRDKPEPQQAERPEVAVKPEVSQDPPAQGEIDGPDPDKEPLLLLDEEPPLLLSGGEGKTLPPTGPVADNSRCHHCHLNYVDEDLALVHARANIGCADCHGNCDAHIADESWASGGNGTPPEIMYPREKVNPCCLHCHPQDKMDKTEHESFLAGTAKEKYCTDCHGDHRLAERKCKWR